ncbi:endoglucanase 19-like isoform X4 [Typha latifolia]|uniref:endoglucanase 19-like isoform X4 n=1 Tax=Typha latifolia TaxID=4733 RepID=UPI003C2BA79C
MAGVLVVFFHVLLLVLVPLATCGHDYGKALTKSILFFEAQRSGSLPANQRVNWRANSGLLDGKANGVDLVGGYYDAGDNVKFGLPMAFTITMMSWSILEYGKQIAESGEMGHAMDAVKWGADYFIKAHPEPYVLYGELFEFGDKYRGKYDRSILVAQKYYQSFSGYGDELLWAAAWLYQATNDRFYLDYVANNGDALGGTGWAMTEFGWDVKYAGAQVLATKFLLQGNGNVAQHSSVLERYQQKAEFFMCSCLGKGARNVPRTPGGLMHKQSWNNLQFVTGASFLLTVYADYLAAAGKSIQCAAGTAQPSELLDFAKSQVDYILGDNPRATSYMVGYGNTYPQQVHHRGSSIVSIKINPTFVSCRGGYATWYGRDASDPNLLDGAIVGGPDAYDDFLDVRDNYEQTEPTTYNNAPMIGLLARLNGRSNQLLTELVPAPNLTSPAPVVTETTSPIAIEQKATTSWITKGKTYHRYSVTVTNNSPKTVKDLHISTSKLHGPLWGLVKSRYAYVFPEWLESLPGGMSIEFVYIHSASPADIWVSGYKLV